MYVCICVCNINIEKVIYRKIPPKKIKICGSTHSKKKCICINIYIYIYIKTLFTKCFIKNCLNYYL